MTSHLLLVLVQMTICDCGFSLFFVVEYEQEEGFSFNAQGSYDMEEVLNVEQKKLLAHFIAGK